MAWKWNEILTYKVAVGGIPGDYYGSVQLMGNGFYALLNFRKSGTLPTASAPVSIGQQRFYGFLDFQQLPVVIDLLRNEKPVNFGWDQGNPNFFQLMTGTEAVGEGDGILAAIE
jgi:hypothetical protein